MYFKHKYFKPEFSKLREMLTEFYKKGDYHPHNFQLRAGKYNLINYSYTFGRTV